MTEPTIIPRKLDASVVRLTQKVLDLKGNLIFACFLAVVEFIFILGLLTGRI